jgi:tRNA threonylcarbamoyl adenosine modification protein (Sua5/YciO/YrdC/YwlC family)
MFVKLYNENPDPRQIEKIVKILKSGGIIIYPTDTVYGLGCDITQNKAVERIAKIKNVNPKKNNFSFICHNISQLSEYTSSIDNYVFKILKKNLPGPFTFILQSNNSVPKMFKNNKKTVGIRIPDNKIILEIVKQLGNPILTTSVYDKDEIIEYTSDPELIYKNFKNIVDIVIDGGYGDNTPSTVIDCTTGKCKIIREGKGELRI